MSASRNFEGGSPWSRRDSHTPRLAMAWKGCSQATSHSTQGSKHPSVNEKTLAKVLNIVVKYLQNTIYEKAGFDICHWVLRLD